MPAIPAVEVEQLRDMLKSPQPPLILDVREQREFDTCRLPGSVLIPSGSLAARQNELPRDRVIVVHCHHGGRSSRAVAYLQEQGFQQVFNLTGGIHAWSQRIDPAVKTYG